MRIKQSESTKINNSDACTIWEYAYPSDASSVAVAHIDGRYPAAGRVVNTECEEVYYVLSGSGVVHMDQEELSIAEGDLCYFSANESWCVEGDSLKLLVVNAPKWRPEQHEIIE